MPRKDLGPRSPVEIWPGAALADRRVRSVIELAADDRSDRRPASPRGELPLRFIADMVSLLVGIIALTLLLFASIPFLATADWLIVPMAAAGLLLGLLARSMASPFLNFFVILIYLAVWI